MAPVPGLERFAGTEREPAAVLDMPRHRQSLQSPTGQADQVLLERVDSEGVLHLERGLLAGRPLGPDEVTVAVPEEPCRDAPFTERDVAEVAENGPWPGHRHGPLVVRPLPRG